MYLFRRLRERERERDANGWKFGHDSSNILNELPILKCLFVYYLLSKKHYDNDESDTMMKTRGMERKREGEKVTWNENVFYQFFS